MFSKHLTKLIAAAAMAGMLTVACGSASASKQTIPPAKTLASTTAGTLPVSPGLSGVPVLIGFLGGAGGIGQQNTDAIAQAAVDYLNSIGGAHGRPFKLVVCDDAGTPEAATQCANEFVSAHVNIAGRFTLNEVQLLTPLEAAGIPVILSTPNSPAAFKSADVIGLTAGALESLLLPAAYGASHGLRSNATLLINTPQSAAVTSTAKTFYAKVGVSFTSQLVNAGTPDLTSAVTSAIQTNPDSLSILGPLDFCLSGLQAAKALGYKGQIFIAGCSDPTLIAKAGAALDGVLTGSNFPYVAMSEADRTTYTKAMTAYAKGISPEAQPAPEIFNVFSAIGTVLNKVMPASSDYSPASILAAFKSLKSFTYPFDGGVTLTCNGSAVSIEPSVCSAKTAIAKYGNGKEVSDGLVDFTTIFN